MDQLETTWWWTIFELESMPPKSKVSSSSLHFGTPLNCEGSPRGAHLKPLQPAFPSLCGRLLDCLAIPGCAACVTRARWLLFILIHSVSLGSVLPFVFGQCPGLSGKVLSSFSPSPCPLSLFSANLSMFTKDGLVSGPLSLGLLFWAQ